MEQLVATSLELNEILLSIADSLNQAQQHLQNMPPFDEFGRPNVMYHLPYLDFNLVVTSSFEDIKEETAAGAMATSIPVSSISPLMSKKMKIRFNPKTTSSSQTTNINLMSNISGRFIAVVPNEGLPQTLINVSYRSYNNDNDPTYMRFRVTVLLSNTAGELCTNQKVEFNFDEQATTTLNKIAGINKVTDKLLKFSLMEGITDENGKVEMNISFPQKDYDNGYCYIIRINSGIITESISICKK